MSVTDSNITKQHENVGERHGLALPIELEEGAPPHLSRAVLAVLSGLIIVLLLWANIARVRELSVAVGEIAPSALTREVAHLEGGIVDEVLVKPGDAVTAGQALVRLRPESDGGEYDRYAARRANLMMKTQRLTAQIQDQPLDFGDLAAQWPNLAEEQTAIYKAAADQHHAVMASLRAKQSSSQSEVGKAEAAYTAGTELSEYAKEQLGIQEDLIGDGFTSKQAYLQAKSDLASATANAAAAKAQLEQARRALTAATSDVESAEAEYRSKTAEERAKAVAELAELAEPIMAMKDRADRLTVRAPVAGVVKDLDVNGAGDVVRPGELVAEITPEDDVLFAEVKVDPKDIGHIAIGEKTEVTVTTFDPNRYGKVMGHIEHVSSDTFTDERTGKAYYTAYIALDRQDVGKGHLKRPLSPGMEVRAEIVTQSRTMMQYLVKPVARSLDRAFTER